MVREGGRWRDWIDRQGRLWAVCIYGRVARGQGEADRQSTWGVESAILKAKTNDKKADFKRRETAGKKSAKPRNESEDFSKSKCDRIADNKYERIGETREAWGGSMCGWWAGWTTSSRIPHTGPQRLARHGTAGILGDEVDSTGRGASGLRKPSADRLWLASSVRPGGGRWQ
jgi:hypothetical protein